MRAFTGGIRVAFLCFFASHIPITLCIDGQGAFSQLYPLALRNLVAWYTNLFGDVLMKPPYDSWFSSLIFMEIFLQLPFFFVAIWIIFNFNKNEKGEQIQHYPGWFQKACLIYGSHVSTTLIPILGTFISSSEMTLNQKYVTIGVYLPYLIFPLLLVYYALVNDDTLSKSKEPKSH